MKKIPWVTGLLLVAVPFFLSAQCKQSKELVIIVRDLNGDEYRSLNIALAPANLSAEPKIGYNRTSGLYEKPLNYPVGAEIDIKLSSPNFEFRIAERPEPNTVVKPGTCVIYAVFTAIPQVNIEFYSHPAGIMIQPYRATNFKTKEPLDREMTVTVVLASEEFYQYKLKLKAKDLQQQELIHLKHKMVEFVDKNYQAHANSSGDRSLIDYFSKKPNMKKQFAAKIKFDTLKVFIK